MANKNLHNAKTEKKDEFYTLLDTIEDELAHYEQHFVNKIVFCNCDDPTESNFWRYFHMNFEYLKLKKLISTHYEAGEVQTYKMEYEGGDDENFDAGKRIELQQNGDFRSPESLAILEESDIIVTNPPFSLFRDYISVLTSYNKKFLVIGSMNSLHYKEIFPLIRDNQIWTGYGFNKTCEFIMPDSYELKGKGFIDDNSKKHGFVAGITWITNLDHSKRHEIYSSPYLYSKKEKLYPDLYIKYDNFDAINVDSVSQIPMDYDGIMGVPDGFLEKFNPKQFEIVGLSSGVLAKSIGVTKNYRGRTDLAYTDANGKNKCPYSRILIKKRLVTKNDNDN